MLRKALLAAVGSLALAAGSHAAPIAIGGAGSTGVSFSGTISYNSASSILTVSLTNDARTPAINAGNLTAFAFNIKGNDYLEVLTPDPTNLDSSSSTNWHSLTSSSNINDLESASPYGNFEAAAGIGSSFMNGSGSDNEGLKSGETGVFSFFIKHKNTGTGAGANLTENDFLSPDSDTSVAFLVRFKGIGTRDDSDKVDIDVVGTPIPLPAAAWGGLALMAGLGAAKLRRARRR